MKILRYADFIVPQVLFLQFKRVKKLQIFSCVFWFYAYVDFLALTYLSWKVKKILALLENEFGNGMMVKTCEIENTLLIFTIIHIRVDRYLVLGNWLDFQIKCILQADIFKGKCQNGQKLGFIIKVSFTSWCMLCKLLSSWENRTYANFLAFIF